MPLWNRIRLLLLLGSIWLILVWASMADNPLLPFVDAVRLHLVESQWLLWLMGLELVRQIHYLVSEHWSAYHRFWSDRVFGGFDRATKRRFSDWTRFRLARVIKSSRSSRCSPWSRVRSSRPRRCSRCSRRPRWCGRRCR